MWIRNSVDKINSKKNLIKNIWWRTMKREITQTLLKQQLETYFKVCGARYKHTTTVEMWRWAAYNCHATTCFYIKNIYIGIGTIHITYKIVIHYLMLILRFSVMCMWKECLRYFCCSYSEFIWPRNAIYLWTIFVISFCVFRFSF